MDQDGMLTEEQLKEFAEFKKQKERDEKLNRLMSDEKVGEAFKFAYEQGGLKEKLESAPEILDSDVALKVAMEYAYNNAKSKIAAQQKDAGSKSGTDTKEAGTATGGEAGHNGETAGDKLPLGQSTGDPGAGDAGGIDPFKRPLQSMSVDELIKDGKLSTEMAVALKAFF